ncbi:MAG TPA: DUF3578 domain-containing protein [Actinophytocola sp.]|uniref:MrcB family domain-containing protein n=1 Tax=Actinophytocola sp. TaxID=1872138 RepID=UPI002DBAF0A0|nr:DUF3578 domain-containing protein [Actinophytocola sp.]HEU5475660.1 DUF3578 domain-containing protein [Actinophytocola sp.]
MDISAAISGVRAHGYDHRQGRDQPAQKHLREVFHQLRPLVPPGMKVLVSGAGRSLPVVPWIAILNTDVTNTAQEGLYVVYLYRGDLSRVYLSMNQGATQHQKNAVKGGLKGVKAERAALAELRSESTLMRGKLDEGTLAGLVASIELGSALFLPRGYEEGNVAAMEYDLSTLPGEAELRDDLSRFLALYDDCVAIKRDILATSPGLIATTAGSEKTKTSFKPRPPAFRPKSSAEYLARVPAQEQTKGRRHDDLLNLFAARARTAGLTPANNVHPCDLTVDSTDTHWLVEAKTVGANAELAVREAIGQLFAYRHFCYRELKREDPALVALFSEPVGTAFVDLLVSLGIEALWRDSGTWRGVVGSAQPGLLAASEPPPSVAGFAGP